MEELNLILEVVKQGYAAPFLLWFLWDKKKNRDETKGIEDKKRTGRYVSWESMDERLVLMESKLNAHLEKEVQKEARFAVMENNQGHTRENIFSILETLKEIKDTQKEAFRLISDMKQYLLEKK